MYKIITYYEEDPQAMDEYRKRSRYLWADHVNYTRNAIISIVADLGDVDDVVDRLMRNQEDLGSLLAPYYSTETVDNFVKLLKQHVIVAGDLIKAASKGEDLESLKSSWQGNANDFIALLSKINSVNWPKIVMGPMWATHMELTMAEVLSRVNKEWVDDIVAYDANQQCMTDLADIFSDGVISQNLESFSK